MHIRLRDIPTLSVSDCAVEARVFNMLRLASLRMKPPLRVALPGLRTLDMLVEHDQWVVVDRSLDDLPIMAWDNFVNRNDLHSPVHCRLRCFHFHAAAVTSKALQAAFHALSQQMERYAHPALA